MGASEPVFGASSSDRPPERDALVAPERDLATGKYRPAIDRRDKHRRSQQAQPAATRPAKVWQIWPPGRRVGVLTGVAVVVIALVAVFLGNRPDSKHPVAAGPTASPSLLASSTSAAATPTPTLVVQELTPAESFSGTYQFVSTLVALQGQSPDVIGSKQRRVWTVAAQCGGQSSCTAVVTSSSGARFAFTYLNDAWVEDEGLPSQCIDLQTGTPNGQHATERVRRTLRPTSAAPGLKPTGFSGRQVSSIGSPCATVVTSDMVMTRVA